MDKEKIEFLDLKKKAKTLEKCENCSVDKNSSKKTEQNFSKNATNPIMSVFLEFKQSKKFNIEDL